MHLEQNAFTFYIELSYNEFVIFFSSTYISFAMSTQKKYKNSYFEILKDRQN